MPNIITEVDRLIAEARARAASDLHIDPTGTGVMVRMRIDGVLDETEALPAEMAKPIVQRLKYLADLLTYRSDIPQEGRMRAEAAGDLDMRVSTFPTIHGERVVVRFFDRTRAGFRLEDLSLPSEVLSDLQNAARGTSGVVLLTGPAGSGKTTTLYACLNDIVRAAP
jgi:type II secretory ATPase GspE/PulE/Tfp pilus assembly ATPase PilB-like protein